MLHRKHYRVYNKTPVTKHIILLTVNLKPLVVRDFLNEIYSDSAQMVSSLLIIFFVCYMYDTGHTMCNNGRTASRR